MAQIADSVLVELIGSLGDAQRQTMETMLKTSEDYDELRTVWRRVDDVQTILTRHLDISPITDVEAAGQ
jgi:hypothetical protein